MKSAPVKYDLVDSEAGNSAYVFDFDDTSGPWLLFLPSCMTVGFMTYVSAILGLLIGAIMSESSVQKTWVECFKATDSPTLDYSCWFKVIGFPGMIWIKALRCLVMPLMVAMMITLPEKLNEIGKIGMRLVILLFLTSFVASMEGLFWAFLLKPGEGLEYGNESMDLKGEKISELESFLKFFELFVPDNIIQTMYRTDILAIISVCTLYGFQICACPEELKRPILNMAKAILRSTLGVLSIVMWFTPIAMFSLISYNLAKTADFWNLIQLVGKYATCQLLGQFFHTFIFYFSFYFFSTGKNPFVYMWRIQDAPVAAIITSSSLATMPVTIRVNKEVGNSELLVQFTIPLGAGMNMDGTALGFPIMVLFTAQMYNVELSFAKQFLIALLSLMCSLGTAPIPNAGLVFLTMLFTAADIPREAQSLGYGLISTIEWMVDRIATAQNVTSDSFLCGILNHYYNGHSGCLSCFLKRFFSTEMESKL